METSAHDNVNVENAFLALAALIDPKCAAAKVKGVREKVNTKRKTIKVAKKRTTILQPYYNNIALICTLDFDVTRV